MQQAKNEGYSHLTFTRGRICELQSMDFDISPNYTKENNCEVILLFSSAFPANDFLKIDVYSMKINKSISSYCI